MAEFTPRILAFCCNYCAYAAADLAGTSRMQYPPNVRLIRVPCSGKVDITYVLRAFEVGADGVIVAGCLEGGCHFIEGNIHSKKRMTFTKDILDAIGIGAERLEFYNLSASMAPRFIEIVNEMTDRIRKLGPLPKKVILTEKPAGISKREFLYRMVKNLALKQPEKLILVPDGLEEFGRIECNLAKCIGCKKCEEICPEKAVTFIEEFDLPTIFQRTMREDEGKVTKRQLLYETLARIAAKTPLNPILVPEGMDEYWKMQPVPGKCVVCEKCSEICPEKAINIIKELDLPTIVNS